MSPGGPTEPPAPPPRRTRVRREAAALLAAVQERLAHRDLALLAAGLTFFAGVAIVPLFVVAFSLTTWLSSAERVRELGGRLADLLPDDLGAPVAVERLVTAGVEVGPWGVLLALLPMTFYGEGLRRVLLRFSARRETLAGWRGRALALPLLLLTPALLYPLLLVVQVMDDLARTGGVGATIGEVAVGFYSVLAVLTVVLGWGFRVVAPGRLGWPALLIGAPFTAACLSGFLQGFVLFLGLPLDLGAPFGDLAVVGGVVALGLWMFALHVVLIVGWLLTQAIDERLAQRAGSA